jgi:hypothetical protein
MCTWLAEVQVRILSNEEMKDEEMSEESGWYSLAELML